jgi:hypothetical protein
MFRFNICDLEKFWMTMEITAGFYIIISVTGLIGLNFAKDYHKKDDDNDDKFLSSPYSFSINVSLNLVVRFVACH